MPDGYFRELFPGLEGRGLALDRSFTSWQKLLRRQNV